MLKRRILLPSLSLPSSVPPPSSPLLLDPDASHYLVSVLRLSEGSSLEVCDGHDRRWRASLEDASPKAASLRLLEALPPLPAPFPVYLAQGLAKGERFETVLRQGTEIGISGFFPFVSERCVVRLDQERSEKRLERWKTILREASRQSERSRLPAIAPPVPLASLVSSLPALPTFVCWEDQEGSTLKDWLRLLSPPPAGVIAIVGPEGGFAPHEIDFLLRQGVSSVGLGPLILRTETAPLAVASILQYHFGFLGGSPPSLP